MPIRNDEDFRRIVQSRIAPIYFYDQNKSPNPRKKLTSNGTVTLFRNKIGGLFGITNFHIYEEYLKQKEINPHSVCQIGHKFFIKLEDRIVYEDEDNDLIVFSLYDGELAKSETQNDPKSGFRIIDTRLSEHLATQDDKNPETWKTHCAGFPGVGKITTQISVNSYEENFGICLFRAPATCDDPLRGEKRNIIVNFSALREFNIIPQIGNFPDKDYNFGGMSGGPILARIPARQGNEIDDICLLGTVYQGNFERIMAKPISLLEKILLTSLDGVSQLLKKRNPTSAP